MTLLGSLTYNCRVSDGSVVKDKKIKATKLNVAIDESKREGKVVYPYEGSTTKRDLLLRGLYY